MRSFPLISLFVAMAALVASADDHEQTSFRYELDGTTFESTLIYPEDPDDEPMPVILMVPNWMGPGEAAFEKARKIAGDDYAVLVVDMYGVDVRPENGEEASQAAGAVRADRETMRARAQKALDLLRKESRKFALDSDRVAAIGFCFGGGAVLELARSGADIDAVVSFHGDLASPTLERDSGRIQAKVLVLHGADDPWVPQEEVEAFIGALQETAVDWQLVQFSNTVHSFTDPTAASPGQAEYHPENARRAFRYMEELFDELWDLDD